MSLKSLKIDNLVRTPVILTAVLVLVVIITLVWNFYGSGSNGVLAPKSSNPESVIPPVETGSENRKNEYLKQKSYRNTIYLENAVYGWQSLFDIFSYNQGDSIDNPSDSVARYSNLTKILSNPNRRFSRGNSEIVLKDYGDVILEECQYYKLDWRLVLSMIRQESAFTSDAVSHAGAYGFMQIMPRTGSMLEATLNLEDHRSPVNNLKAGIYYYAMLVGRYDGAGDTNRYKFALAAYNAGSGHVEDAMSLAYYHDENYLDWDVVKEYMKLLAPGNDSLHQLVWGSRPPNGVFANWKEPYNYVDNIIWYWQQYKKVYPLPGDNPRSKNRKKKKK